MRVTSGPLTRRRFITDSASAAALTTTAFTWAGGIAKPYLSRAADRPLITHRLQSGDMGVDSGVVWARTDRPAPLWRAHPKSPYPDPTRRYAIPS